MRIVPLALALAVTVFPLVSFAQEPTQGVAADEQVVLRQVMTDKRAVYAKNLGLTESESRAFWPVYDEYEAAAKKIDDRFLQNVDNFANKYDSLSEADAKAVLKEKMAIEKDRMALKQKYTAKVAKVLPPKKALRYAQIETRVETIIRSNVYTLIPLAN
jgi:Spy/CpxP family protein refolding chaperone